MSSARTPPNRKNTIAVVMKRAATSLWFTVAKTRLHPAGVRHVSSSSARSSCTATASRASSPPLI
jgi:hypothetical protein